MAVTGAKLLSLCGVSDLAITRHALARLREYAGGPVPEELAFDVICKGQQITQAEVALLGYRPGYARRMARGVRSWYVRIALRGRELIAVLGDGEMPGEMAWVTTYAPNREMECFRVADFSMLRSAG